MRRTVIAFATILSLAFTPLAAQDFGKGFEAYEAGDFATALQEWTLLADQGDASAQTNLGNMYYKGRGVPQDDAEAVKWYRLAADQGDAGAQGVLATMYGKGQGVPQDYAEAVKWYRLAADQGDAGAQFILGIMYAEGRGVPQDYIMSHMWYNIASANRYKDAGEARDKIARLMTSIDISKAQAMARECVSSGYAKCGY